MRTLRPLAAALAITCLLTWPASAKLLIEIDKSAQRMTVSQDGSRLYTWPVSTGARGYDTPGGQFKPFRMEKTHFSREWDDAPMPNSIFFTQRGHAIHGTNHLRNIGQPVSHGCVRLEPQNARVLFGLVKQEGMANTRIVLSGATGAGAPAMVRRNPYQQPQYSEDDDAPRRVERTQGYQQPGWGPPPGYYYERSYRPPQYIGQPQYIGPRNPYYGWD